MKRFALIQGGCVSTVVEQDDAPTIPGEWVDCTGLPVGPGAGWSGSAFTDPISSATRHITKLAFLSRFTDAEAIAIDLASIGATQPAAAMRRYQSKVNAALYIDLDRQETRAGVEALEAVGLLATGRAAEILDVPITPTERNPG